MYEWIFVSFEKALDENKLLYECKILWDKIMKEIKILFLKSFDIIYVCVKYMIRE
jgi:hypothetical protein